MKKLLLLPLIALLLFACNKKGNLFLNNRFKGTWEYENFSGYPFNNNYLPPGNGRILYLGADGTFERRQHDTVLFRGRYYLEERKDCHGDEKKIHFSTNDTTEYWDVYINFDAEKLTFSTTSCYADGGTSFYRRIQCK